MTEAPLTGEGPERPRLTVIGEALIDLVPDGPLGLYRAKPGGSPFNVAVGLARLGHRTSMMARLADNAFGRLLAAHAAAEHVDVGSAPRAVEPTTLAVVSLDHEARATYDFYLQGTADWQWTDEEMRRLPGDTAVLHVGSLASWTPPGDARVHAAVTELRRRGRVLISYDPNIRPMLLGKPSDARPMVERYAAVAHIVKASRDDIEWLYPGAGVERVGADWLALGASLVVITDGPDGAHVFRPDAPPVHRPGRRVVVADTVGAGDAFTSGLLGGLVRRALYTPESLAAATPALLADTVDEAVLISALTCQRPGADPPTALPTPAHTPLTPTNLWHPAQN